MPIGGRPTAGPLSRADLGAFLFPIVVLIMVGTGAGAAMTPLVSAGPWIFGFVLSGWVVTLCLHEFAHSVAALAGGDSSVRARGYLTLNPLKYTNPVFSLILPIIFLMAGGLPLPGGAVLIETHRLRRPWWSSVVSAAGPSANLISGLALTLLSTTLLADGEISGLGAGVAFLALLQFVTFVLNLLPVPGLDGFGVLAPFLSPSFKRQIAPFTQWAPLALFAVLWTVPASSRALFDAGYWFFDLLHGNHYAAGIGQVLFQFWR